MATCSLCHLKWQESCRSFWFASCVSNDLQCQLALNLKQQNALVAPLNFLLSFQTQPIPIPLAPLSTLVPRLRCSVEGLNQELEAMLICQPTHTQPRVNGTSSSSTCCLPAKLHKLQVFFVFLVFLSSMTFQTATGLPSHCRAPTAEAAVGLRVTLPQHHCLPPPSLQVPRHPTCLSSHSPLNLLHLTCSKVCGGHWPFSPNAWLRFTAWNKWKRQHLKTKKTRLSFTSKLISWEGCGGTLQNR